MGKLNLNLETRLEYALAYATLGWPVLPLHWITEKGGCSCGKPLADKRCKAGKHPLLRTGLKEASTDHATIGQWFGQQYPNANIGIVTGAISGLLVVDVDPKNGGEDTLDVLRGDSVIFPDDVMQITGSGGRHFFYQYPGELGRSRTNLWPGIDIRGDGGYIVAPPSNHVSGNGYFWDAESDPLAGATLPPCPDHLLARLAEKPQQSQPADTTVKLLPDDEVRRIRAALGYIPADDRDTWLHVGMALHDCGAGEQAFGLWCEWSQKSKKFNFADSSRVWASFTPGNGIHLASVFGKAKDNGWSAPKGARFSPPESPPAGEKGGKRKDLEAVIDKTDDVDELIGPIVRLVHEAGLSKAAKDQLLGKIARKTQVSRQALLSGGGNDDGADGSLDGRIMELNNRHAVVPMGGRTLILNREYDPALKKNYFTFSGRHDFELLYCNKKVYRRGEPKGIGEVWVNHPDRLQYEGITFQPGGASNGFLNLWQGWGVEPVGGECHRFLEFIGSTICSADEALLDYIIKWCAHLVQRPHELPETALVLRGKEGAGKNRFVSVLGQIVGSEHFLLLTSMGQVSGRFSGHLSNALLVFCNEAVWGGDKSAQGVLKSMITDNVQPVEYKGRDISMVPNFKRLIMASNEDWVVPRGANDRHYVIIDVDDAQIGKFDYWAALQQEIEGGCAAAFMRYLLAIDIEGWHPREIPQPFKERGWDLKIRGAGSVVQWWFDVLEQGWITQEVGDYSRNETPLWPKRVPTNEIQALYVAWATKQKVSHIEHKVVLGTILARWGIKNRNGRVKGSINGVQERFYFLPELDEARKLFSKAFDIPEKILMNPPWEDEEEKGIY